MHVDVPPGQVWAGVENRIDLDETYFLGRCAAAGLTGEERIGEVYGQVVHRPRKAWRVALRNSVASRRG